MTIFLTQKTEGEGLILVYCFWVFSPWWLGPCAWAEYYGNQSMWGQNFFTSLETGKRKQKIEEEEGLRERRETGTGGSGGGGGGVRDMRPPSLGPRAYT